MSKYNNSKAEFNRNVIQALTSNWGWDGKGRARCPGHKGEDKNLAVTITPNNVLLYCHSRGCSHSKIIAGLGVKKGYTHKDPIKKSHTAQTTTYPYLTKSGKVIHSVRTDFYDDHGNYIDKGFSTDPAGSKEKLLPYGFKPNTKIDLNQQLILVEGEKSAHALLDIGIKATTGIGGSKGLKRSDWSILKGHNNLVIWADEDEAGQKWETDLTKILILEGCKIRKVPVKFYVNSSQDCADLSPEEIKDCLARAINVDNPFQTYNLNDLVNMNFQTIEWLVEGCIPVGGFFGIGGKPKGGKSTISRQLALSIANGADWLGRSTKQSKVLYIGLEDGARIITPHLCQMVDNTELIAYSDSFRVIFNQPVITEEDQNAGKLNWLRNIIYMCDSEVVIIDPLFFFLSVEDGNNYSEILPLLINLKNLGMELNIAIGITHHTKKGKKDDHDTIDSMLGSTAITGTLESIFYLKKGNNYQSTFESRQRIGDWFEEVKIELDPTTGLFQIGDLIGQRSTPEVEKKILEVMHYDHTRESHQLDPLENKFIGELPNDIDPNFVYTRKELDSLINESDQSGITKALQRLEKSGEVSKSGKGVRGNPFVYSRLYKTQ